MKTALIIHFKTDGEPNYVIAEKDEYKSILNVLHRVRTPRITDVFINTGFFVDTISSSRRLDFPSLFEELSVKEYELVDTEENRPE